MPSAFPPPHHVALLTVAGTPLRVARVTPTGIEVPLTAGARERITAEAQDGWLQAELALVGPDWEASYVLPFEVELREAGRAWLAFAAVDAALARALDRFGVVAEAEPPPRRMILPESGAVWAVTQARRAGTFGPPPPEPEAEAVLDTPPRSVLVYAALAASALLALLALVLL